MSLRRISRAAVAALLLLVVLSRPAHADVTVFTGTIGTVGGQEQVVGGAASWFPERRIQVLRIELESWATRGVSEGGRNVSFFGARLIVQWPERRRLRPFVAAGFGLYGETIQGGAVGSGEASGRHVGAGVKARRKGGGARADFLKACVASGGP